MKVLITNSHADNRGDEAAQRAMIRGIKNLVPETTFTVMTISPEGLELDSKVEIHQTFSGSHKTVFNMLIIIWTIFRSVGVKLPTFGRKRELFNGINLIADSDVVISAPGGPYFGELYKSHEMREHILHVAVSWILGKPIMVYGPSMGPFSNRLRNIIRRFFLEKVKIISLRDKISMEYLSGLQLKNPLIYQTADSALQGREKYDDEDIKSMMISEGIIKENHDWIQGRVIGITPTGARWNYKNSLDEVRDENNYCEMIANTIDEICSSDNTSVVFIPQLYGRDDDLPLIQEIIGRVKNKELISILSPELDSDLQQGVISKLDCVIGNRYHSVIFALNNITPVICIAYEHKSVGIMEEVGLSKFTINIEDASVGRLIETYNLLIANSESIRATIRENLPKLKRKATLNTLLAAALIKSVSKGHTKRDDILREVEMVEESKSIANQYY